MGQSHLDPAGPAQQLVAEGFRAFVAITQQWQLSSDERLALLGHISALDYATFLRQAKAGQNPRLNNQTLMRISLVLAIWKQLSQLFPDSEAMLEWLYTENAGAIFGEFSPQQLLLSGDLADLGAILHHLTTWHSGVATES